MQDARLKTQKQGPGCTRVKVQIPLASPDGKVGSGQVMIYSGSAPPISSGPALIYLVTCLSNLGPFSLFQYNRTSRGPMCRLRSALYVCPSIYAVLRWNLSLWY